MLPLTLTGCTQCTSDSSSSLFPIKQNTHTSRNQKTPFLSAPKVAEPKKKHTENIIRR